MTVAAVNCPACNHGFETDAEHGDAAGGECCDFCVRITCPGCRHVFFRATPAYADKPPAFFRSHRFASHL